MEFSDARAKVKWADHHIEKLEKRISDLPNSYMSRVDIDPNLSYHTLVHDIVDREEIFTDIALRVGDVVHNLKCALDYAWVKTIELAAPSAISKYAKFPVYETFEALEGGLRGNKIDVSCPRLFDLMLNKIRPYSGGNYFIWAVYALNKRDKHRLLIPLTPYGSIASIVLEDDQGLIHQAGTWGTEQSPPYYITFAANLRVKEKGNLLFSIAIDETLLEYAPSVEDTFSLCSRYVIEVIETLELFCETI